MNTDKVIVTAALSGVLATKEQCPHIPYSVGEMVLEAKRACDAGAAAVHVHGRESDGSASWREEVFAAYAEGIRAECDLILNFSTGGLEPREERVAPIRGVLPELGALNMGSMNYAIYSRRSKRFYHDHVFANPFGDIEFFLRAMREAGVKPELECFDSGHVRNAEPFFDLGLLEPPVQFSLILGVLGGAPPTARTLAFLADVLPPRSTWEVIGIGRVQWRLCAAALALGGNVRVGLEDNFYLPSGEMAPGNGALVEEAVRLARATGREPATPAEARAILGLPAAERAGATET